MIAPNPTLPALAETFQAWLDEHAADLLHLKKEPAAFEEKAVVLRELQAAPYDSGFARVGWPEVLEELFLPTLRGDLLWCQGFSEPTSTLT